ncbi:hypothetical protein [Nonomuraea insulae]|uniref:Uncharacterized protein n=1 Tax=Nonomuraea insulae TaxID=1616787 RepID=A0ABW1D730_9ACTN
MTTHEPLTAEELAAIEERAEVATPGPWFIRLLDDEDAMNLVAISTVPDTGHGERWPDFDHHEIVAATLIQQPRYVDVADARWDENAQFIANARQDIPRLITEIKRLRQLLAEKGRQDLEA